MRLNHCSMNVVEKTANTSITHKDDKKINELNCAGCMLGNNHRAAISTTPRRTHFEPLKLLIGDCVERCTQSVFEKKGALISSFAGSGLSWTTIFR